MTTGGEGTWAQLRYTGANLNIKLLMKKSQQKYTFGSDRRRRNRQKSYISFYSDRFWNLMYQKYITDGSNLK